MQHISAAIHSREVPCYQEKIQNCEAGEEGAMRGGSFFCIDQYCSPYMVGTRGKGEASTGTNHLGFHCVKPTPPM
jgi:formylglycine-generating enzyme required for sulfatase activity